MRKRFVALCAVLAAGLAGRTLVEDVPLYFGRCDPVVWSRKHPAPKALEVSTGPHRVELVESRRVVPSAGLPGELALKPANNNLDVVRHLGRTYLAFRNAPSHFASSETVLHVLESSDEVRWRAVGRFALGRDLREPRWLSVGEKLFLYVTVLGDDPFDFRPEGVQVSELLPSGRFGPLTDLGLPGRVAWRARWLAGRAFMTVYAGGEKLYSLGDRNLSVELLTSLDGRHWKPLDRAHPVVIRGGGSETDFAFQSDGSLFAVVRNEAGDASGFGSKLCRAPRERLSDWRCTHDPKKYDSPNVFLQDGALYVFGRRHLTDDGRYDVSDGPPLVRMLRNQLAYISEGKRCALWRLDPDGSTLGFVLDLPSKGDTCFTSILPGERADELVVYDYSSDIDGPELPWSAGQRRPTFIYRHVLRFVRP